LKAAVARPDRHYVLNDAEIAAPALEPGLYVTATPIGNLGDVTLRALETLAGADLIACEDTRVTSRLTKRYGIETPLLAYHEHNAAKQRPRLLAELGEGRAIALVSDAGTPLVSDPGYRLVTEAIAAGHKIVPIPGASAMLASLVGSGLPSNAFLFAGFLPPKSAARKTRLAELAAVPAVLGSERPAAVGRELTKMFEAFRRGTLAALAAEFAGDATPKGEITIVVGPPVAGQGDIDVDALLRERMPQMSLAKAVAEVAAISGAPRNAIYRRALTIKAESDAGRR
jgi:16S rRNA (cytidine1402-2'-O)-methyltransferase